MDIVTDRLSLATKVYAYAVVGGGTLVLASALTELSFGSVPSQWVLLAALTLFGGIFATRIPSLNATLSVSETLVLALVVLFGPAPAMATVAADGLIASAHVRRWSVYRALFNVAAPALSVWCAARVFQRLSGAEPLLLDQMLPVSVLLVPLVGLGATYYAVSTVLMTLWTRLESGVPCFETLHRRRPEVLLNLGVTVVLLALLVRSATSVSTLAICASGIVLGLIALSHTFSKTYIAHVETTNRHLAAMNELYVSTVETLASTIDAKDQVTAGHIRRVQQSALRLAPELGVEDPDEIKALECASLLHDLGKLVVPEHVLNKPGSLSGAEVEQMKSHASLGADILSKVGFPYPVEPIVRHHHENWDGTGYPDGLRGNDIPLGARILSVVDCFDALTSDRPYRRQLSCEVALDIVRSRRGTMYDPAVVDKFLEVYPGLEVAQKKPDSGLPLSAPAPVPADGSDVQLESKPVTKESSGGHSRMLARFADALHRRVDALPGDALLVVYRRDTAAETLRAHFVSNSDHSWIRRLSIPVGEAVAGWVGANKRAVVNADPLPDFQGAANHGRGFRSCVSTPIQFDGVLVGVLSIYSVRSSAFNHHSEAVVNALAGDIAAELSSSDAFASVLDGPGGLASAEGPLAARPEKVAG